MIFLFSPIHLYICLRSLSLLVNTSVHVKNKPIAEIFVPDINRITLKPFFCSSAQPPNSFLLGNKSVCVHWVCISKCRCCRFIWGMRKKLIYWWVKAQREVIMMHSETVLILLPLCSSSVFIRLPLLILSFALIVWLVSWADVTLVILWVAVNVCKWSRQCNWFMPVWIKWLANGLS